MDAKAFREKMEALYKGVSQDDKSQDDKYLLGRELAGIKNAERWASMSDEERERRHKAISKGKLNGYHPTRGKKLPASWREKAGKKISQTMKKDGIVSGIARKVNTPDGVFNSVKEAYQTLGMNENALRKRLKDQNNKEYFYIDEEHKGPIVRKNKMKPLMTPDGPFDSTKSATAHFGYSWAENCTNKIKQKHPGWYWLTHEEYENLQKNPMPAKKYILRSPGKTLLSYYDLENENRIPARNKLKIIPSQLYHYRFVNTQWTNDEVKTTFHNLKPNTIYSCLKQRCEWLVDEDHIEIKFDNLASLGKYCRDRFGNVVVDGPEMFWAGPMAGWSIVYE